MHMIVKMGICQKSNRASLAASRSSCAGQLPGRRDEDAGCAGRPYSALPAVPGDPSPFIVFHHVFTIKARTFRALGRGWLFDGSEDEDEADEADAAAEAGPSVAMATNVPIERVFAFECCSISKQSILSPSHPTPHPSIHPSTTDALPAHLNPSTLPHYPIMGYHRARSHMSVATSAV